MNTRGSVESSRQRFHRVDKNPPSTLDAFLHPGEFGILGFFKVHDTVLKLRKAGAHIRKLPIVFELHVDFLGGETTLQNGDARGQILDLAYDAVQICFLPLHDPSTSLGPSSDTWRIPLRR